MCRSLQKFLPTLSLPPSHFPSDITTTPTSTSLAPSQLPLHQPRPQHHPLIISGGSWIVIELFPRNNPYFDLDGPTAVISSSSPASTTPTSISTASGPSLKHQNRPCNYPHVDLDGLTTAISSSFWPHNNPYINPDGLATTPTSTS